MRVKKDVYTRVDIKRENDGPPPVCGDDREGGEYFDLESDGNADDRDGKGDLDMDKAENDQDKEKDQPYIDGGGRTLRKRKPKLSVPSPLPSPPRPVKKRKLVDVAREKVEERFLAGPAVRGAGPAVRGAGPAVRGLGLGGVQLPVLVDGTPDVVEASHPSGTPQELLKIIHRFTSQYYTERSLLSNASREYRRVKRVKDVARAEERAREVVLERVRVKEEKVRRREGMVWRDDEIEDEEGMGEGEEDVEPEEGVELEEVEDVLDVPGTQLVEEDDEEGEEDDQLGPQHQVEEQQDDDDDDNPEEDEDQLEQDPNHEQPTPRIRGEKIRDMYKGMDGSALFALGMLVQTHITILTQTLVKQRIFTVGEEGHTQTLHPDLDSNTAHTSAGAVMSGMYTFETDPEDTGVDEDEEEDIGGDGNDDSDGLAEDETGDV
ncbi:hypothetical protein BDV98DRAFT_299047 [Pterulicium gracile]|uniref:Uncharacterized protein n=1 Tax=Pterulicium gracile TaxID=1884261 RepID=A0A5C3Q5L9_9AGAR|nr:hypothetical protein BDV98DRAFT_299047 [Pterula gracilis]